MNITKLVLSLSLVVGGGAVVQAAIADQGNALPQVESQGAIRYMTGGIGSDEQMAMQHVRSRYPLSLEFATKAKPRDEYLADVGVTIKNRKGVTEFNATSDGPFLFVDLPPGQYVVTANDHSRKIVRHVDITAGKPERLNLVW